jgi:membrane dipeptidase
MCPNRRRVIVDSHEDIAFNAVVLGQDFLSSAYAKRTHGASQWGIPTVGFPELKEANVRLVFASIWAAACGNPINLAVHPCYETPEEAWEQGQKQLSYYQELTANPEIHLIETKRTLGDVTGERYQLGLLLSMEGADPILSPKHLNEWVTKGLRVVGLAHGRTRYSGGTRQAGPLTDLGRDLLSEMEREHIILDTSHMAEESFFDALRIFHGPIIATHSNCRELIPTDRQLSDEMIHAIVKREGIIGGVLFNKFLTTDWEKNGRIKKSVTLTHFVKQLEHLCDVAGDTEHVGIGSDLDGGFGSESIPAEMDSIADMPKIASALGEAGFSETEVNGIMGENWLRFLRKTLPE